jgi:TP901 family phage tail tape measure protein
MDTVDLGALHGDIEVDAGKAVKELQGFADAVDSATESLEETGQKSETTGKKVDELEKKVTKAGKKSKEAKQGIDELGAKIGETGQKSDTATPKVDGLGDKIGETGQESDTATPKISGLGDEIKKTGQESEVSGKKVDALGKKMTDVGQKMTKAGKSLSTYVTAPIMAAAAAIAKFGMDFETVMDKVATLAGGADMDKLRQEVLDISSATGIAASTIAEAQYQALSSGVTPGQTRDILMAAAKSAKGGFTDAVGSIDGLTNALNAYALSADHATEVANKYLITQNLGKTTFGEIAANIGKVAPTAYNAGMSIDELLASVTSLTSQGIATETSMVGLKAALSNVIKPSKQAQDEAKKLGLDFSIAALQGKGWAAFLSEINAATQGDLDALGKLFRSTEALNTVLTLTSENGGQLMAAALSEMKENTSALDDAYATMMDNSAARLTASLNKAKNSAISFFETLAPAIESGADIISTVAEKLAAMDDETKKGVLTAALIVAAIGPVLMIGGQVIKGIGVLRTAIVALGATTNTALPILGAIALAIGAIAAITGACVAEYKKQNKEALALVESTKKLKKAMDDMGASLSSSIAKSEATAQTASRYAERLKELEAQGLKTTKAQEEYSGIVTILNRLLPELNLELDKQTGLLKDGSAALGDMIQKQKELAIVRARETAYEEGADAYVEAMAKKLEADAAYAVKTAEKEHVQELIREKEAELIAIGDKYTDSMGKKSISMEEYTLLEIEYAKVLQENLDATSELTDEDYLLEYQLKGLAKAQEDATTTLSDAEQKLIDIDAETQRLTKAMSQKEVAEKKSTAAAEQYTRAIISQAKQVQLAELAQKRYKKSLVDAYMATDEAKEKSEAYFDSMVNGFKKLGKENINLSKATKTLKETNDANQAWADSLQKMADKGFSDETIAQVRGLGVEYRDLVKEMADKGVEKSQPLLDQLARAKELAEAQVRAEAEAMGEAELEYKLAGESSGEAYSDGVIAGIDTATLYQTGVDAAKALNTGFTDTLQIQSPSKVGKQGGGFYGKGIVVGADEQLDAVKNAGAGLGSALHAGFAGVQGGISGSIHGGTVPSSVTKVINQSSVNSSTSSSSKSITIAPSYSNRRMSLAEQNRNTRQLTQEILSI